MGKAIGDCFGHIRGRFSRDRMAVLADTAALYSALCHGREVLRRISKRDGPETVAHEWIGARNSAAYIGGTGMPARMESEPPAYADDLAQARCVMLVELIEREDIQAITLSKALVEAGMMDENGNPSYHSWLSDTLTKLWLVD
jgi:hypothetical protein